MAHSTPAAKIVRIKNKHIEDLHRATHLDEIEEYLNDKNFLITEQSEDGLIVTYSNDKSKNTNQNTFIFLNKDDKIMDIRYTHIE